MSLYDFRRSLNLSISIEDEDKLREEVKKLTKKESQDLTEFDLSVIKDFFGWTSDEYKKTYERWFLLHSPDFFKNQNQKVEAYKQKIKTLGYLFCFLFILLFSLAFLEPVSKDFGAIRSFVTTEPFPSLIEHVVVMCLLSLLYLFLYLTYVVNKAGKEKNILDYMRDCIRCSREIDLSQVPPIDYATRIEGMKYRAFFSALICSPVSTIGFYVFCERLVRSYGKWAEFIDNVYGVLMIVALMICIKGTPWLVFRKLAIFLLIVDIVILGFLFTH